jgi:uncharacterized membrane protein
VKKSAERLSECPDSILAVPITILVLELHPSGVPTVSALLSLGPTWLAYAVSYVLIAIVWAHLTTTMHYAKEASPGLMWFNFAHLFSVSLLPLSTA